MDLRFAMILARMANYTRAENTPAYTPADFMPDFLGLHEEASRGQTAEEQQALLEQVVHMTGGKVFSPDATDEEMEAYVLGLTTDEDGYSLDEDAPEE